MVAPAKWAEKPYMCGTGYWLGVMTMFRRRKLPNRRRVAIRHQPWWPCAGRMLHCVSMTNNSLQTRPAPIAANERRPHRFPVHRSCMVCDAAWHWLQTWHDSNTTHRHAVGGPSLQSGASSGVEGGPGVRWGGSSAWTNCCRLARKILSAFAARPR